MRKFFVFFLLVFGFLLINHLSIASADNTHPDCVASEYSKGTCQGEGELCVNSSPGESCHDNGNNNCPSGYNNTGHTCALLNAAVCCAPIPTIVQQQNYYPSCSTGLGTCISDRQTCATAIPGSYNSPLFSCANRGQCCIPQCDSTQIGGKCSTGSQGCSTFGNYSESSLYACTAAGGKCCLPKTVVPPRNLSYKCISNGGSTDEKVDYNGKRYHANVFCDMDPKTGDCIVNSKHPLKYCAADQLCADATIEPSSGYPCVGKSDVSCSCTGNGNSYTCLGSSLTRSCPGTATCDSGITQGLPCDVYYASLTGAPAPCKEGLDKDGKKIIGADANGNPTADAANIVKCTKINTAVGDIALLPTEFVSKLLAVVLSISGGVALLLIIMSGYNLALSQANPEKIKEGRERLTAAIIGLVFIVFAAVLLEVIGVNVLGLPGF